MCDGNVGDRWYLASGVINNFGSGYNTSPSADPLRFFQDNILTIEMTAPGSMGLAQVLACMA